MGAGLRTAELAMGGMEGGPGISAEGTGTLPTPPLQGCQRDAQGCFRFSAVADVPFLDRSVPQQETMVLTESFQLHHPVYSPQSWGVTSLVSEKPTDP